MWIASSRRPAWSAESPWVKRIWSSERIGTPVMKRSRSSARCLAESYRRTGSFAIARTTIRSRSGLTEALSCEGGMRGSRTTAKQVFIGLAASKGGRPVSR